MSLQLILIVVIMFLSK